MDYWFEGKRKYLPNPNRATTEWRRDQQAEFLAEVHRCLHPLEEAGFKFVFPNQWLIDYPLTSICLGVEVQDFFTVDDDIVVIAQALNGAACKFDYLQIVLTIGSRQYQRQIQRINRDSIETLSRGKQPNAMWIFPVDPPEGIQDVLPDLLYDPLPELDRVQEFYTGLSRMTSQTRLWALANQLLHPPEEFEERLLRELEAEALERVEQAEQALEMCLHLMEVMVVPAGSEQEWQKVIRRCHELIAEALATSSAALDPLKIDRQLQAHLLTYLDHAYLRPR